MSNPGAAACRPGARMDEDEDEDEQVEGTVISRIEWTKRTRINRRKNGPTED